MSKKTKTEKKPAEPAEEELSPYEQLVGERLQMLQADYDNFERPDYLEDGQTKLVPFLMSSIAELFVRVDIILDKIPDKEEK